MKSHKIVRGKSKLF